ncbi:MAG: hypothetical protein B7Z16_01450 [Algoriphagus sp. 32-45-6]|nr:MAG: hypothetical protein B7Z16_01450 [Algoriphagus sp. 32-45-6]
MAPFERPAQSTTDLMPILGRALFFDPILSASGQIACASCHHPDLAFTDGIRSTKARKSTYLPPGSCRGGRTQCIAIIVCTCSSVTDKPAHIATGSRNNNICT